MVWGCFSLCRNKEYDCLVKQWLLRHLSGSLFTVYAFIMNGKFQYRGFNNPIHGSPPRREEDNAIMDFNMNPNPNKLTLISQPSTSDDDNDIEMN